MKCLTNCSQILTLKGAWKKDGRNLTPDDLGIIEDASLVCDHEKILWVGASCELPSEYKKVETLDMQGQVITPELVDSHTHLVFGGNRASEYAMRLNGADYQEIAKAGGGILSTMKATNEASKEELFETACDRIERLYSYGIGTIEIKSGYGLNIDKERELTLIIDKLKKKFSPRVQIFNTFMPAHAIPKNFQSGAQYLEQVVYPLLNELAPLGVIDAVDIFHEEGYFGFDDTKKLFLECRKLGLKVKIHADEFGDNGGAELACEFDALSADHLLCTGKKGIEALSKSPTVSTLLPGTGFFLGKPQANARALLDAGAKVAIGSDYNPGSCHWDNLLKIASISAPQYRMNQCELWAAITMNAASALGFRNQGALIEGLTPRFSRFNYSSIDEITYHW